MRRGRAALGGLILVLAVGMGASGLGTAAVQGLPERLTDQEFWRLTEELSEPSGYFRSDNLVSDEMIYADVVPDLVAKIQRGGVFLGVGPEQNFTYIAAIQPRIAFVLDIRRGNLLLQLMYKALFELSADRADFISRLFTKQRPAGLGPKATARALMEAYWNIRTGPEATYRENLQAIQGVLVKTHGFGLSRDDLNGIEYVYHKFYWFGPSITWASTDSTGSRGFPPYAQLLGQEDGKGQGLSFLATEAHFTFVKNLQAKNLVIPVVGNFAGPKALRAIGQYVRDRRADVSAFYVSEVEPYLHQDGLWPRFCANVATLPLTGASVFIHPPTLARWIWSGKGVGDTGPKSGVVPVVPEVKTCGGSR